MFTDTLRRSRFRLRRGMESHGAAGLVRESARRLISADEEYVWYALDLGRVRPIPLPAGYHLHLATEDDAELLRELPAIRVEAGRQRVAKGVQLWFVLREREPAFVCFCYPGMQFGGYRLPDYVACLENGLTSRKHRGRLIAPAAWTEIAERLREDGFEVLITKVEAQNAASRRTLEKTGFRAATVMHRRRRGIRTRVLFRDESTELTEAERRAADDLKRNLSRG